MTESQPGKSDLGVRTLSAIVMLAVAGGALWLGGWWWALFVVIIAAGVAYEWFRLASAFSKSDVRFVIWILAGAIYLGLAAVSLIVLRVFDGQRLEPMSGLFFTVLLLGAVIGVDVGAYLLGRAIGGPKIAPSISPSKTWAGLVGGVFGAFIVFAVCLWWTVTMLPDSAYDKAEIFRNSLPISFFYATVIAFFAQAGDFFESWMKRKAGVKDSGNLIPGHGGLFDRVDGLLAVSFLVGVTTILPPVVAG